jgi:hypothetical protein
LVHEQEGHVLHGARFRAHLDEIGTAGVEILAVIVPEKASTRNHLYLLNKLDNCRYIPI